MGRHVRKDMDLYLRTALAAFDLRRIYEVEFYKGEEDEAVLTIKLEEDFDSIDISRTIQLLEDYGLEVVEHDVLVNGGEVKVMFTVVPIDE